jgi:hypothetical protein
MGDAKMKIMIVLIWVCLAIPALGKKKVNPEDFKLEVMVTEVNSQTQVTRITTTHPVVVTPCRATDPRTLAGNCPPITVGGDTSKVESAAHYLLTTEIGDKVYDLRGPRLELGIYHARFTEARRGWPAGLAVLGRDERGRPAQIWYRIVGERLNKQGPK